MLRAWVARLRRQRPPGNEEDVMVVAGKWSVNPQELPDTQVPIIGSGVLGRLPETLVL